MKQFWAHQPWGRIATVVGWTGSLIFLWGREFPLLPLRRTELTGQAIFMQLRNQLAAAPPPADVVIVAIDDESLNVGSILFPEDLAAAPILKQMTAWPWPRQVHAEVTRLLLDAGAKAVVFDIVFSTQSAYGQADDFLFQQALQKYGSQVVLGGNYTVEENPTGSILKLNSPHPDILPEPKATNESVTAVKVGYVNVGFFVNGIEDSRVFALSNQLYDAEQGFEIIPSLAAQSLLVAGVPFQTPPIGSWIHYYSKPFLEIPYSHLFVPDLREKLEADHPNLFRDKIVLIGATAPTLKDFEETPVGRISGPQIQASQIATLANNQAIRTLSLDTQLLLLLLVGLVGGTMIVLPARLSLVIAVTGLGLVVPNVVGFALLVNAYAVPISVTSTLMLLGMGATEATRRAIRTQLEKLRLRRTLDRYVSGPVAAEIMSQPENFANLLKGRKRQVAVLFSDIRGFTTLSSELPAEALIPQLNDYLNAMVQVITDHEGCIDKFIGDAVMAEFGSPISQGSRQDALNAVKSALRMRRTLAALRQTWTEQGLPLFFAGIGINFGDAVAGNIGSLQRLEYTVLGDTVNVASRVESLTKEFATDIIITQSVYDLVFDQVDTIPLGNRHIRGRSGETGLFQVIGHKGNGEERTLFDQVHQDYLSRLAFLPGVVDDESLLSLL